VLDALTGSGIAWAYNLNREPAQVARIVFAALFLFSVAGVCHMLWDPRMAEWVVYSVSVS